MSVSRYRLYPNPEQEAAMLRHCSDARYVWNLAWNLYQCGTLETYGKASRRTDRDGNEYIHQKRRPVRQRPSYVEQAKQLTEARAEFDWLRAGSVNVQQQALRDFEQAIRYFFDGTRGYPGRRKKYRNEGFRITDVGRQGGVKRLNRHWGAVFVPKIGWVRFRWSRAVPECKSYRVTRDRVGRWHVAFAMIPAPIPAPSNGEVVGIDRGVTITAALSTGETLHCPTLTGREQARIRKAFRRAARAPRGSAEKDAEYTKVARMKARDADRRKDWAEKVSTDVARRFDIIRVEDLRIKNMTRSAKGTIKKPGKGVRQKAGLNRAILAQGWGLLTQRITEKAPGRVEKVPAPYTSLRCSDCGWIDKNSRQSQAGFVCVNCGFTLNADLNAAINIAAGHAGGTTRRHPLSVREPQWVAAGIPVPLGRGGCQAAGRVPARAQAPAPSVIATVTPREHDREVSG